jgi:hypothetical protein
MASIIAEAHAKADDKRPDRDGGGYGPHFRGESETQGWR